MYKISISFCGLVFFLITFNTFAESPGVKAEAHLSGSGSGGGDGSGRNRTKSKEYVDPLTYEERLANRGKGSGGLGLGRIGKPPKGKKGGGQLISILAPENTKDLLEMLAIFYKKKYDVKFQIGYFPATDASSVIESKSNVDLLITDDFEQIKKLNAASQINSQLNHYSYRAVFLTNEEKAMKLKDLKGYVLVNISMLQSFRSLEVF